MNIWAYRNGSLAKVTQFPAFCSHKAIHFTKLSPMFTISVLVLTSGCWLHDCFRLHDRFWLSGFRLFACCRSCGIGSSCSLLTVVVFVDLPYVDGAESSSLTESSPRVLSVCDHWNPRVDCECVTEKQVGRISEHSKVTSLKKSMYLTPSPISHLVISHIEASPTLSCPTK